MIVTTTCIDVRFTAKNGDTPGSGKFERIEFSLGRWVTSSKKNAQIGNMSVEPWNLSEFFFIHYCGRGSHFPQGHFTFTEECTDLEFSDWLLVFVILHQEGY